MASFSKLIELTPAAWKQLAVNIQVVTSREESGAHLGLHGVTDGDVSLHCEGGEEEGGGVHGQELKVDQDRTAQPAPEPLVPQDVVRQDLLRTSHVTSRVRARDGGNILKLIIELWILICIKLRSFNRIFAI